MFFSRVASFLTFALVIGSQVIASPVADLEKRADGTAAIQGVFTTLKTTTDSVLPQLRMLKHDVSYITELLTYKLESIAANKNASSTQIKSLINDVVVAVNNAHSQVLLMNIDPSTVDTNDIAQTLANTISVSGNPFYSAQIKS